MINASERLWELKAEAVRRFNADESVRIHDTLHERSYVLGYIESIFLEVIRQYDLHFCSCGKVYDHTDGQQAIAKMCQTCLDNAQ